jgi:hypothetical protein
MKRIQSDSEILLKVLAYGQPGSTKTRTVSTAALDDRTWPVLMLDAGGNPLSIREYARKPDIIQLDALEDLNPIYRWLALGQPPADPLVKQLALMQDGAYKSIIIDGITDIQRFSFAKVVGNVGKLPGELLAPTQIQHHQSVLQQMTNMARLFFKLPLNVFVTALEKETQDANGQLMYRPLLTGQAPGEVGSYAYTVMRLVHRARVSKREQRDLKIAEDPTDQTVAVGFFRPSGSTMAKDQHGIGVDYMVDPTVTKMLDSIEEHTPKHAQEETNTAG